MSWNHDYRMLDEGETIIETDEVQNDDGSWAPAGRTVGMKAPCPFYSSHRVYRRHKSIERV